VTNQQTIELIGICAVVLSLVFVGFELRQNSSIARTEVQQSFTASLSELSASISHDSELAVALQKVLNPGEATETITEIEHIKLQTFIVADLYVLYGLFLSVEEGVLPEEYLSMVNVSGLLNNDYFRNFWPSQTNQFSPEFVAFFETLPWNNK